MVKFPCRLADGRCGRLPPLGWCRGASSKGYLRYVPIFLTTLEPWNRLEPDAGGLTLANKLRGGVSDGSAKMKLHNGPKASRLYLA